MDRKPLSRGTKGLSRGKPLERGSGLSPGKPLARGKGLERGESSLDRSSKLAPRSKARAAQMKDERAPLVQQLVDAGIHCEIAPIFEEIGVSHPCAFIIGGMHERRKSSSGGSRLNHDNLIPACNSCNGYIEDAVGEDRERIENSYLVVREGHPEWDQLSKRHDRTA